MYRFHSFLQFQLSLRITIKMREQRHHHLPPLQPQKKRLTSMVLSLVAVLKQQHKQDQANVVTIDALHSCALQEFERLHEALMKQQQTKGATHTQTTKFREIMARDEHDYRFDFRLDLSNDANNDNIWKEFEQEGWWKGAVHCTSYSQR
mmetsp:Transcript_2496/g.3961  ORF Transcript_2496/g.3961 Transcript_2496/m.3961 type:complete len:149 (+) Transcript_2496:333-779(+)